MRFFVTLVALLMLLAAPTVADDLAAALDPDAALIAQQWGGDSLTAVSWHIATVARHRLWADLLQPMSRWGAGLSADLVPGRAVCVGGGYQQEWLVYVGAHVEF